MQGWILAAVAGSAVMACACASAASLTVDDFTFEGPLGSQGTTIKPLGENHFEVTLGHAPEHEDWNNKLQFTILRNAKGNPLTLDVVFEKGVPGRYNFNEYAHSYSYDQDTWFPVHWESGSREDCKRDRLTFPVFTQDKVYAGHQVPMSYEMLEAMLADWRENDSVTVHVLGKSLGGRDIYRLEVTAPDSPHPLSKRWVHYFANQHPGEHNSQWRMAGMLTWLLSGHGRACLETSICHFVFMTSPDAPSHGWYRVNAQGVDMNRSYRPEGAGPDSQAHEAAMVQAGLEALMASDAPPTTVWSMHTWGGMVDPRIIPGPEMGKAVGTWEALNEAIQQRDPDNLIDDMQLQPCKESSGNHWTEGPHLQFGVTSVLCEGAGAIYTKAENVESGVVLMEGIAAHYAGLKP